MAKKILIIDSDQGQIDFFKQGLAQHNYSVSSHSVGRDILEHLKREKPDLVLLNILDVGKEVLGYLKEHVLPFMAICKPNDANMLEDIFATGASGILVAPINISQLVIEIETVLHFYLEKSMLDRRNDNINSTIENNRKISLAIGLVMERYKVNGENAFDVLRRAARNSQRRVLDIASTLIKEHEKALAKLLGDEAHGKQVHSFDYILNEILETTRV